MSSPYETEIWQRLSSYINNDYGVAGLMGNLQAESGLIPYRKQGDFTTGYTKSLEYTDNINDGTISKNTFVHDAIGYGLAQWTFSTRKSNLYDFTPLSTLSIASLDRQIPFLMNELTTSYVSVLNTLRSATNIRTASDAVLHDFENPAEQGESVEIYRAGLGQQIYDRQHSEPGPGPDPPVPPGPTFRGIPYWMMWHLTNQFK